MGPGLLTMMSGCTIDEYGAKPQSSRRLQQIPVSMPFEFVADGAPVSQQTRRRGRLRDWILQVRMDAARSWDADHPFGGEVMVTITYIYESRVSRPLDIDNVVKPILDALKGLVYFDDGQVTDLICRKRAVGKELRIPKPSRLLDETHENSEQFVHVEVDDALSEVVSQ